MAAMVTGLGLMVWVAAKHSRNIYPVYSSKEDCEREWSDRDCQPEYEEGNNRGAGGGSRAGWSSYHGPSVRGYAVDEHGKAHPTDYEPDGIPERSRAWTLSRGGFGSAGGRYGAGS